MNTMVIFWAFQLLKYLVYQVIGTVYTFPICYTYYTELKLSIADVIVSQKKLSQKANGSSGKPAVIFLLMSRMVRCFITPSASGGTSRGIPG